MKDLEENIKSFTNEKLCEIVISSRYLNTLQFSAILCMEELANRRVNGDVFNFEEYIENESKQLPDFKFDFKKVINLSPNTDFKSLVEKLK